MGLYKDNGNDINNWTYTDIVVMVDEFKKLVHSGEYSNWVY